MREQIRFSTQAKEGLYQASKWLKLQLLINPEEMSSLLDSLGDVYIAQLSQPTPLNGGLLTKKIFLEAYTQYIEHLRSGSMPPLNHYRPLFSCAFTTNLDSIYRIEVGSERQLIKISHPVVQSQLHNFNYSEADQKFHSMVFGEENVTWGIQFSFPQFYQDSNLEVFHLKDHRLFPNLGLFQAIQKWVRYNTTPTPFLIQEKRVNCSIRIGNCFEWINCHPQLACKKIQVHR